MKIPFPLFISLLFYCFNPSIQLLARRRFLKQGKFIVDYFHQLVYPAFKTVNVSDAMVCTLECIGNDMCLSFNLAVQTSANGLKLCQLLSTDKYESPQYLKANATFDLHSVDIGLPAGSNTPCEEPMELNRYYWDGEHKCSCPEDAGAKYGWVKLNSLPLHVEAKDDKPGKFTVLQAGRVEKFKLVHLSGAMTCWPTGPDHYPTKLGCGKNFHMFITDSNKTIISPNTLRAHAYDPQHMIYLVKCAKTNDSQVVLSVESTPLNVISSGQELQVWYGEDLVTKNENDNVGSVNLDVYANFTYVP